jgi:hypothetical protein
VNINPGDTVRYRIGPNKEPMTGLVLQVNEVRMIDGCSYTYTNVQWVEHSGQPGKCEWHRAGELVVVKEPPHA